MGPALHQLLQLGADVGGGRVRAAPGVGGTQPVQVFGGLRVWDSHVLDVDLSALRAEVHTSREYVLNTPTA
ncbi:hypothetical protein ACFY94_07040 [Streptomyces griseorubiginosus]|uniref:hypothetical protein n=1 Tax=Streptomyces griseorubiginosus TaxID=67304 RepID=UPI0036E0960F